MHLEEGVVLRNLESASFIQSTLVLWLAGVGGALVGLAISTLSKTERMAVMILPIALLLQVLLSRVVFGHSAQWDSQVPVPPVAVTQPSASPSGEIPANAASNGTPFPLQPRQDAR